MSDLEPELKPRIHPEHRPRQLLKRAGAVIAGLALIGLGFFISSGGDDGPKLRPLEDPVAAFIDHGTPIKPDTVEFVSSSEAKRYGDTMDQYFYHMSCDVGQNGKLTKVSPRPRSFTSSLRPVELSLKPNTKTYFNTDSVFYGQSNKVISTESVAVSFEVLPFAHSEQSTLEIGSDLNFANEDRHNVILGANQYIEVYDLSAHYVVANRAGRYSVTAACALSYIQESAGYVSASQNNIPDSYMRFGQLPALKNTG